MSISPPPPDTRERSLPEDDVAKTEPATESRPKRTPDYRLRGLDSAALKAYEPVARAARPDRPSRKLRRRRFLGWFIVLAVLAGGAVALRLLLIQPYTVRSVLMTPTLRPGDRVLVVKASRAGALAQGDIVVVNEPNPPGCSLAGSPSPDMVLRVIALPGQTILSSGGNIYVDGRMLHESGWYNRKYGQLGSTQVPFTTVPKGSYFLMADNRSQSCDSRVLGAVPGSSIVGKVDAILLRAGHPFIHTF